MKTKIKMTKIDTDLFASIDLWRFRWCVVRGGEWDRLHRIVSGSAHHGEQHQGYVGVSSGRSLCGLAGDFQMPGIFSRMGLQRCANCCRTAGIPTGAGAPFNVFKDWMKDA